MSARIFAVHLRLLTSIRDTAKNQLWVAWAKTSEIQGALLLNTVCMGPDGGTWTVAFELFNEFNDLAFPCEPHVPRVIRAGISAEEYIRRLLAYSTAVIAWVEDAERVTALLKRWSCRAEAVLGQQQTPSA
jgi:hypothetical protein